MERKTVILNTDPEPPETAEEQEPSEHDVFHKAFHVVLNQLVDDAEQNTVMDYPGVMSVVMAMFKVAPEGAGLLVRPEVARQQIDAETAPPVPAGGVPDSPTGSPTEGGRQPGPGPANPPQPAKPKRYHGTVALDPARVGRDASRIADEVITHLVGLVGSNVRVSLEIDAEITAGVPDNVVRTVTENSRTLKFESNSGFEKE